MVLKIMTCGSVDDGKSTLLGKLFYETGNIFSDQVNLVKSLSQSRNFEFEIDYSLFFDGLLDEKNQGITIDLSFRFFKLKNKKLIFIDSPGHKEYTKNMANAATFSNVAIVVIDINQGISEQFNNHIKIISLFKNIKFVVVCVNKMDTVNFSKSKFNELKKKIEKQSKEFNLKINKIIPVSSILGDNITNKSKNTPYYDEGSLIEILTNLKLRSSTKNSNSIVAIRAINKFDKKRIYGVEVLNGKIKLKDTLINQRTHQETEIEKIYLDFDEKNTANTNDNPNLEFKNEISILSDDILASSNNGLEKTDSFISKIIWIQKEPPVLNRTYNFQFFNTAVDGFFSKHKGKDLDSPFVYKFTTELFKPITISDENNISKLSNFLVIDKLSGKTVGFGINEQTLDRGVFVNEVRKLNPIINDVNCLWFTGLSGSGKTTIAIELSNLLSKKGIHNYIIDGDKIRKTLNKNLGFSESDIHESQRRIIEVAKILKHNGIISIVTTISPKYSIRDSMRSLYGEGFKLIFIDTPLEECIKRDPKKMYQNKKIKNIVGLHSKYDIPEDYDIRINTLEISPTKAAKKISEIINF